MREIRTYGSVRGAARKGGLYFSVLCAAIVDIAIFCLHPMKGSFLQNVAEVIARAANFRFPPLVTNAAPTCRVTFELGAVI